MRIHHASPLLKTKITAPPLRQKVVFRGRLLQLLENGLRGAEGTSFSRRLTLVSAPAGFGKTPLVETWIAGSRRAAWLSLDEADNDPLRFWPYFFCALQQVESGLGRSALAILRSSSLLQESDTPSGLPQEEALTVLLNELLEVQEPLILVLDDYHHVRDEQVHRGLTFLVENMPPTFHLVLTSRTDPPVPLPRWRSKGWMLELRQAELRFNPQETARFMETAAGSALDDAEISMLSARTEGWAAGLQVASISLVGKSGKEKQTFLRTFSESKRFLLDYLTTEILDRLEPHLRDFLLQTSILTYLTPSICSELTGRTDAETILEELESKNLFIVPLEREGRWYRYHTLFAELLRVQLAKTRGKETVAGLHRKAGRWFEANGHSYLAIEHTLNAGSDDQAAAMLEKYATELFNSGEQKALLRWMQEIPRACLVRYPRLLMFESMLLYLAGKSREAEAVLEKAGASLQEGKKPAWSSQADHEELEGIYYAVKAFLQLFSGNVAAMEENSRLALQLLPEMSPPWRSNLSILAGDIAAISGKLSAAVEAYTQALADCRRAEDHFFTLMAGFKLTRVLFYQGRLTDTDRLCLELLEGAAGTGFAHTARAGCLRIMRGMVACERNRLDQALEFVQKGLALIEKEHLMLLAGWAYACLARVQFARDRLEDAAVAVRQAESSGRAGELPYIENLATAWKARLWTRQGRRDPQYLDEAYHLLLGRGLFKEHDVDDEPEFFRLDEYLALARVLIARGEGSQAERFLPKLQRIAAAENSILLLTEVLLLRALAQQDVQEGEGERAMIKETLQAAGPRFQAEGFVRVFVDEGPPAAHLLERARQAGIFPALTGQLLAAFPAGDEPDRGDLAARGALAEPLSEREREILQLLHDGLSNPEIAAQLYLSLNTVKWHLKNIYGKLDVDSRTAAAARARSLGLV